LLRIERRGLNESPPWADLRDQTASSTTERGRSNAGGDRSLQNEPRLPIG